MTSSPPEPPTIRSFSAAVPNRRSYSCYNCSHSFYIIPATVSPSPSSFRCPQCLQRHLIPHHTVLQAPTTPLPPPPVDTDVSDDQPGIFTYYTSDEFESDYEDEDSDINSLFFPLRNYQISPSVLESFMKSLPVKSFSPNSTEPGQACPICMDDFVTDSGISENAVVVELDCKHCFHKTCIHEWLGRSNTCPLCRYKVLIEPCKEIKWGVAEIRSEYGEILEFHLDQAEIEEVHEVPREPIMRRVNAEVSLSAIAEADASGSDWRVLSTNSGERSRWFDPMHDEDGDTLMTDA